MFVSKTPHVAFLYPGQARSCVSIVCSLEFEDWGFLFGDFEFFVCFGHMKTCVTGEVVAFGP